MKVHDRGEFAAQLVTDPFIEILGPEKSLHMGLKSPEKSWFQISKFAREPCFSNALLELMLTHYVRIVKRVLKMNKKDCNASIVMYGFVFHVEKLLQQNV